MALIRVGISGWSYRSWRGDFYPTGLAQRLELAYAAERMSSVEINGSFYSLQRPTSYERWRDATPPDFELAVKGGRYITHLKRLAGVETALANFFASGPLLLGEKLGPVLWQLPATLAFDAPLLGGLLRAASPLDARRGGACGPARRQAAERTGQHQRTGQATDSPRPRGPTRQLPCGGGRKALAAS